MYNDNYCPATNQSFSRLAPAYSYPESNPQIVERNGRIVKQKTQDEIRFEDILRQITTYLISSFNSSYVKQQLSTLYFDIKNRNYTEALIKATKYKKDPKFHKKSLFSSQPSTALKIVNEFTIVMNDMTNDAAKHTSIKGMFQPEHIINNTPLGNLPFTYIDATEFSNGQLFIKAASCKRKYIYLVDWRNNHFDIVFVDKDILVTHLLFLDKSFNGQQPRFESTCRSYSNLRKLMFGKKQLEPLLLFSSMLEFSNKNTLKNLSFYNEYISPKLIYNYNHSMTAIKPRILNEFRRYFHIFHHDTATAQEPELLAYSTPSFFAIKIDGYQPQEALIKSANDPNDKTTLLDDESHFIAGPLSEVCTTWNESDKTLPEILTYLKKLFTDTGCKAPNNNLLLALLTFQKAACFESLPGNFTSLMILQPSKQYDLDPARIVITGHSENSNQLLVSYSQNINGFSDSFSDLEHKYVQPARLEISYWLTGGNNEDPIKLVNMRCELYSNINHRGATRPQLRDEIANIWLKMTPHMDTTSKTMEHIEKNLHDFYKTKGWESHVESVSTTKLLGIFSS